MDNFQLKAILMAQMTPLGANLKLQPNTMTQVEQSANAILEVCELSLEKPKTKEPKKENK